MWHHTDAQLWTMTGVGIVVITVGVYFVVSGFIGVIQKRRMREFYARLESRKEPPMSRPWLRD